MHTKMKLGKTSLPAWTSGVGLRHRPDALVAALKYSLITAELAPVVMTFSTASLQCPTADLMCCSAAAQAAHEDLLTFYGLKPSADQSFE